MSVGDEQGGWGERAVAYRARWVVPVDQPPIEGGVVTVVGGRIVAVGKNHSAERTVDLGDAALLPGFVNAHTHLEFSLLKKPLGQPGIGFADWIREVVALRRQGTGDRSQQAAVRRGVDESRTAGIVAVGEIASGNGPAAVGTDEQLDLVVFRELLGLSRERIEPLVALGREHVERFLGHRDGSFLKGGLSPHAPYTVHPQLLARACGLSAERKIPLAMHLAESCEELELLRSHAGPLVELLKSLGAWHADALPINGRPLWYLQTLATAHHSLVIHGNYLASDEVAFLAAHRDRLSLVYCPRTHAYFGHEPYPLPQMLAAGVRVAVGTDSRASNPDLRLLEELRHIARHHPTVPPETILRMGTLSGAEALGLAERYGSIAPGKPAALVAVPISASSRSPLVEVLSSDAPCIVLSSPSPPLTTDH